MDNAELQALDELQPGQPNSANLPAKPDDGIKRDSLGRRLNRPAKRGPYAHAKPLPQSKIDVNAAFKMRLVKGMTYEEIGKQFGVTAAAVCMRLKTFKHLLADPEQTEAYRNHKTEVLDQAEATLLSQVLNPKKLKDASANNVAYALRQVHDIGRLERGQSTANISVMVGLRDEDREWLSGMAEQLVSRILDDPEG